MEEPRINSAACTACTAAAPPESEVGSNPPRRARFRLEMFAGKGWRIICALGWVEMLVVCCRAWLGPGFAVAKVRRCGAGVPLSRRRRRGSGCHYDSTAALLRQRPSGTRTVRGGQCDPLFWKDRGVSRRRVFPPERQLRAKEEQVVERRSRNRSRRLKAGSRRALRVGGTAFSSLYPRTEEA